jgi:hypothetical protein
MFFRKLRAILIRKIGPRPLLGVSIGLGDGGSSDVGFGRSLVARAGVIQVSML